LVFGGVIVVIVRGQVGGGGGRVAVLCGVAMLKLAMIAVFAVTITEKGTGNELQCFFF
jgi:hypothetical protein